LLDVDGVLANFIEAVLRLVEDATGRKYVHGDIQTWEVFESLPAVQHLQTDIYEQLRSPGGCYNIPVYEGAVDGVASLREVVDVVIVTSPFPRATWWMVERERWLADQFGIEERDVIHTRRKELIHGDFLVEDKAENGETWQKEHPRGLSLLWDRAYNQKSQLPRVRDWKELRNRVLDWPPFTP
jgi:5'(3')-deoxyribonucleotidase